MTVAHDSLGQLFCNASIHQLVFFYGQKFTQLKKQL